MPHLIEHVDLVLQGSVMLLVVTLGMNTTWHDVIYLIRRPGLLTRSLVARNVVMPFAALILVRALDLRAPVSAVLLAVSISGVPPMLPRRLLKAGGSESYAISLLASQSLIAIAFVPLSLSIFNAVFGTRAQFARNTGVVVASLTIAPLLAGIAIRRLAPRLAERVAGPLQTAATLLLAIAIVLLLPHAWRAWSILVGNGTLMAVFLLIAIGIGAGHLLGGPREQDRTSLALASISSNPGLAIAILSANAIQQSRLAAAAVLLYLAVSALVSIPYMRRRGAPATMGLYRISQRRITVRPGLDRRHDPRA